jgi:CheY-like chemotaxis protein
MNVKPLVLSVDDEYFFLDMITETLCDEYEVVTANNGEEALAVLDKQRPELIILDVQMPQLNGYETCSRIRTKEDYVDVPILFVSAKDAFDDRIKGLEVGGDDYLTKPINLAFLDAKVKGLMGVAAARRQLKESVAYTSAAAMTAMTSMSELGCLLEAYKAFNGCVEFGELAKAVVTAVGAFGLQCVVQLRTPYGQVNFSSRGPASPLDLSIIDHMTTMERIVQFKSRMSVTYERASLLVNNMPVDDADRCGRLRDHLAMLIEAAQVRIASISASIEAGRRGEVITQMIERISHTLTDVDRAQREGRAATLLAVNNAMASAETALLNLALSDKQERYLVDIIRAGLDSVLSVQGAELEVQDHLSAIVKELQTTLEVV